MHTFFGAPYTPIQEPDTDKILLYHGDHRAEPPGLGQGRQLVSSGIDQCPQQTRPTHPTGRHTILSDARSEAMTTYR
ncbi:hypothetical protein VTJ04DRAFT_10624 [Mycothermus thermophilus]|uniref:uncharacterized protein n=1 Tax=Humicola insolens TaxID=85995 RepID=UPI003743B3D8